MNQLPSECLIKNASFPMYNYAESKGSKLEMLCNFSFIYFQFKVQTRFLDDFALGTMPNLDLTHRLIFVAYANLIAKITHTCIDMQQSNVDRHLHIKNLAFHDSKIQFTVLGLY